MDDCEDVKRIFVQLKNEEGQSLGAPFEVPSTIGSRHLQLICYALKEGEEKLPYKFFINDEEIRDSLETVVENVGAETEGLLEIIFQPQAMFRVRTVTRCSATMEGHTEAVLSVAFSPDGSKLASGSGDFTVRFWDPDTQSPQSECCGHKNWVLCIAWSHDGLRLASACKDGVIYVWNAETGKQIGKPLAGHRKWVTALSWRPFHLDEECRLLASSSKDYSVKIWDTKSSVCVLTLSGHSQSVTCLRWGGTDLIYTSSQDRTVKVWRATDGVLCRTLQGHAHWVNTLALNTDYVLRAAGFDPLRGRKMAIKDRFMNAPVVYASARCDGERLVSGSDDYTMFLWSPESSTKSIARMTGHQGVINDVRFSPDGRHLASASFDKSVKLWDGRTGAFLTSLRGHVNCVYVLAWSADSRLLVSGSSDSTLKVWSLKERCLSLDLPGHLDEVYAVDWSPDGERVVSGGKDRALKIWRK